MKYKRDYKLALDHLKQWWNHKGLAAAISSSRTEPVEKLSKPPEPATDFDAYCEPVGRIERMTYRLAHLYPAGDRLPILDIMIGPGSLSTFLGAKPHFSKETIWYDPCIANPDTYGPVRFDPANQWFQIHLELAKEAAEQNAGRYIVGMPDLIENLDTLASLRGTQELLMDLVERPAWVHKSLAAINDAFFRSFDMLYKVIAQEGGNAWGAFDIWGPGKTAKVQCDFSCMISPKMFDEFVKPCLDAQCDWLDYSMYHLDGEDAMQHVDSLLSIESLDAIEWTPVGACGVAGLEPGGSPKWYDLYRRIKAGGKSVQAIGIKPAEIAPLLDAVGPEGMMLLIWAKDPSDADEAAKIVEKYR